MPLKRNEKLTSNKQVPAVEKISAKVSSIHTDFGLDSSSGMGIKLSSSVESYNDNLENIGDSSIFEKDDATIQIIN